MDWAGYWVDWMAGWMDSWLVVLTAVGLVDQKDGWSVDTWAGR